MVIDFYTNNSLAMEYPPLPAKKIIPEWYRNTSKYTIDEKNIHDAQFLFENEVGEARTIKSCVPVQDYLTSGYVIRAHAQTLITPKLEALQLDANSPKKELVKSFWWKSVKDNRIESHGHVQCPVKINGFRNNYFKYDNPWKIKTPEGYSCLFYRPEFFFEERYQFFPAIVDCDVFDSNILFPGVIKSSDSFYINPGDPLVVVFPFKREEWQSKTTLVSEEEWNKKKSRIFSYMFDGYKTIFHQKKSYK